NYRFGLQASVDQTQVSSSVVNDNVVGGIAVRGAISTDGPDDGVISISDSEITGNGAVEGGVLTAGLIVTGGDFTGTRLTVADNFNGVLVSNADVTLADSSVTGSGADAPTEVL